MKHYTIIIHSNEHPRTINTPANGRVLYTAVHAYGADDMREKVEKLRADGEHVSEIFTDLGTRIYI